MNDLLPVFQRAESGFTLDLRQSGLAAAQLAALGPQFAAAHAGMQALEAGAIMNRDEYRQVTHFRDRVAYPQSPLYRSVEEFAAAVRAGKLVGSTGKPFDALVVNGIGGSALGPQLVQFALHGPYWNELPRAARGGGLRFYCTDNTDSAGVSDLLRVLDLETTLVLTISKSGGTRETANNLAAFEQAYAARKLAFAPHAAAITMPGSKLSAYAAKQGWPPSRLWDMADSIGGRTSETAVVGHVPAAATGVDFAALLAGACQMDEWTRVAEPARNPAYLLAAAWYLLGHGRGERAMVIVPYSDRLVLLSRYLQQLVMESLGKERDRAGNIVNQGLTVYGNKGGTDAHAYIQQLQDGRDDFFITFIEVLRDAETVLVDGELSMGDYLHNFLQGLANALTAKRRPVLRLTLETLDARSLGLLIALYERAVAVYAELININAFHQPGVEGYKQLSGLVNKVSGTVQHFIAGHPGFSGDAADFARALGLAGLEADVEGILAKFAVNGRRFGGRTLSREFTAGGWRYRIA